MLTEQMEAAQAALNASQDNVEEKLDATTDLAQQLLPKGQDWAADRGSQEKGVGDTEQGLKKRRVEDGEEDSSQPL